MSPKQENRRRSLAWGEFPSGTDTFLFTNVEGSTDLFHRLGANLRRALLEHRRLSG